jgi:hypothetical protein
VRDLEEPDAARSEHRGERDSKRALGHADRDPAPGDDPGDRTEQQPAHSGEVDVPVDEVADAGHPEEQGGVEDVRADDLHGGQRKHGQHHEREERAAADRDEAD